MTHNFKCLCGFQSSFYIFKQIFMSGCRFVCFISTHMVCFSCLRFVTCLVQEPHQAANPPGTWTESVVFSALHTASAAEPNFSKACSSCSLNTEITALFILKSNTHGYWENFSFSAHTHIEQR